MNNQPTRRSGSLKRSLASLRSREFRAGTVLCFLSSRRVGIIIGLGIAARLAEYLWNRGLWLDEGSLAANIIRMPLKGLFGPLLNSQLAPPGFLVVEWLAVRVLGRANWVMRLFPMICGIAALFLFRNVARRALDPRGIWVAVALFAVSEAMIYFSSELKQYMTDVAAGLICVLMGLWFADRPRTPRRLLAFAAAGAVIVWFSHASAFVLAGVGGVLWLQAVNERYWRRALCISGCCLVWLVSFAGVYKVSINQLGHGAGMWVFWNFSFPPWPPASAWDAFWPLRAVVYFFVYPLNFETPLGPRVSIVIPILLFVSGVRSLWRRNRLVAAMLFAPVLITLGAAYARAYPFHGRLVLFLVPTFLLFVSEGADWVGRRGGRVTQVVLLVAILLFPTLNALNFALLTSRDKVSLNSHGDRIDYRLGSLTFPF